MGARIHRMMGRVKRLPPGLSLGLARGRVAVGVFGDFFWTSGGFQDGSRGRQGLAAIIVQGPKTAQWAPGGPTRPEEAYERS